MRPTSEKDNVHDRDIAYPEANDPSPSPWAEAPAQREPDHDGQLYVGAAHPDSDPTPEEAEHHEPVAVDESGEPVDRTPDEEAHDASADRPDAIETAHDDRPAGFEPVEFEPIPISTNRDEVAHDETAYDETAHDETAHETAHDEDAPHDETHHDVAALDETHHDAAAHDELAADERDTPGEPAQVVPVVADRDDRPEPTADLDHDGAADEPAVTPAAAPTELKPGDVAVAPVAFLGDDTAQDLRQRWREAQFGFVDDPRQAAEDVRALVNEAIDTVTAALASQRDALGTELGEDTEQYRATVRRCRALFDRLLNL
jgi:hypothetical protein